jgi:hypothetical protein
MLSAINGYRKVVGGETMRDRYRLVVSVAPVLQAVIDTSAASSRTGDGEGR